MTSYTKQPAAIRRAVDAAIHDHFDAIQMPADTAARLAAMVRDWRPETERSERATQIAP